MTTPPPLEIFYSLRRLVVLTASGVVVSAVLVGGAVAGPPSPVLRVLNPVLAVVVIAATVIVARRIGRVDRPVVVLTATGVSDDRVALREIPWLDVVDVVDYRVGREEYVALIVEETVWDASEVRTAQRRARRFNSRINVDGLFLNPEGTTVTQADLLDVVLRYWGAARAAAAR